MSEQKQLPETKKETSVTESHRLEIEIAVVLLGFIFVMYSIILTMPSDVLKLLNPLIFTNLFGIPYILGVDLMSVAGLYCSFSLLCAIPSYLLFVKFRKECALLIARSLLAVGLYFSVILLIIVNVLFSARLVSSTQVNTSVAPLGSLVLNVSSICLFFYLPSIWLYWLYKNRRYFQKVENVILGLHILICALVVFIGAILFGLGVSHSFTTLQILGFILIIIPAIILCREVYLRYMKSHRKGSSQAERGRTQKS
jgi:hypothetical protein